jgi:hypothetical protein
MFLATFLKAFCTWCDQSFFGNAIRNSKWLFPFVEIVHLLALGILGGAILLINMRALGLRFRNDRVSDIAKQIEPWIIFSLIVMLASGFFLFSSEAMRMYFNLAFRFKMACLLLALVFTFTLYRKVMIAEQTQVSPRKLKLAALLSITLWSGVALAGRAIGYTREVRTTDLSTQGIMTHRASLRDVVRSMQAQSPIEGTLGDRRIKTAD